MVLAVLMTVALEANSEEPRSEDELPLGFLEFLGGMVEVEGAEGRELVDPLDFEQLVEPETPAPLRWDEPGEAGRIEEVAR